MPVPTLCGLLSLSEGRGWGLGSGGQPFMRGRRIGVGCVRLAAFEGRHPLPLLDEKPVLILNGVPQGSDLRDELGEGVRGWQGIAIGRAPVPPERLPAREAQERSQ